MKRIKIKNGTVGNMFKNKHWDNQVRLKKDMIFTKFSNNYGNYKVRIGKHIVNFDYKNVEVLD